VQELAPEFSTNTPDDLVARGVLAWAGLFGCVSFEVFGQYGPDTFQAVDDLFDLQLQLLADTTGLTPGAPEA
jgi:hypothetical protein